MKNNFFKYPRSTKKTKVIIVKLMLVAFESFFCRQYLTSSNFSCIITKSMSTKRKSINSDSSAKRIKDLSGKTDICRCSWATKDIYHKYHDEEWGRLTDDDQVLFEFLILEGGNLLRVLIFILA